MTSLQSNAVSHWLGANLESAMNIEMALANSSQGIMPYCPKLGQPVTWLTSPAPQVTIQTNCDSFHTSYIEAQTKWTQFHRQHFQIHFLEWKCMKSIEFSLKCVFKGPNQKYFSIGSDNGLAPTGDKPLSEPMMFKTKFTDAYICVTRPQPVNTCTLRPWQMANMLQMKYSFYF